MKVKVEELDGSRRLLEIEIPFEKIAEKYEEVYSEIEKRAEIPGFRAGKAPRHLVEKHYKGRADEEVKKRLMTEHVAQAADETGVSVIGRPEISEIVFEDGNPFKFKVEINVKPEVKLRTYKGIKVTKQKAQVLTEDVDKVLEELRERHSHLKDVEGRPAKEADWCLCDVEISVEGKPGEKNEGVWFPLDAKTTKPEFLAQLTGAVPGDTKTIKTVLPANYPRKDQAGKEATFIITVNHIKEKIMPAVDDQFANQAGGFKSLLELRGQIREELTKAKEQEIRFKLEEDILNQIIKSANFEVPALLVDTEMNRLLKEMRSRLQYMGYKKEDIDSHESEIKEKIKQEAIKRVKVFFILEKIAKLEGIAATEEEINKRIELLASHSKRSFEETKQYITENYLLDDIKTDIVQDKALEFLVANSKIEEA